MPNNPFHRRDYQTDFLRMESHVDLSSPHSLRTPGCQCFGYSDLRVVPGGRITFEGFVASRWTLEYIQEGKGRLTSDGATQLVGAGTVILRNPRLGAGTAAMSTVDGYAAAPPGTQTPTRCKGTYRWASLTPGRRSSLS